MHKEVIEKKLMGLVMAEKQEINFKNTAKITRKHITGLIISNFIGYLVWSVIYAGIIYAAAWWAKDQGYQVIVVNMSAIITYIAILILSFIWRMRSIYNGFKDAALDAAEEVLTSSNHKTAKVSSRGFKVLRWFIG